MSSVTGQGSIGLFEYFSTSNSIDARPTRITADFNRDSIAGSRNGLGWRGIILLPKRFRIDSLRFYDPSGSVDTIMVWTLKEMVKPDTLSWPINYTPDYLITTCGTCAGLPVTTKINALANDTAEVIFVVFRRTAVFAFGNWFYVWPDVRNFAIFGTEISNLQDTTYMPADWAKQQWTAKPIRKVIGHFNLQNQQKLEWSDTAFTHIDSARFRTFDQMFFFDAYTQRLNMGGGGLSWNQYNISMYNQGHPQFSVVFGNTNKFNDQLAAAGHIVDKGWGTNNYNDDPQKPQNYSDKGRYMHGLAWIGGSSTGGTPIETYNGDNTPHRGYLIGLGSTNEPTLSAFPNAWKNAWETANECHGIYDSAKAGDPNIPVILGAFEAFNFRDARYSILGLKIIARSRNIKADGVAIHGYHSSITDAFRVAPTADQQIGAHGVDVGFWDDWRKTINGCNMMFAESGNPDFIVQMDEDGHQKGVYIRSPQFAGHNISQLGTPRYTLKSGVTLDAYNSQGVAVWNDAFINTASPISWHYHYAAVDDGDVANTSTYDAVDQNNGKFRRPADFTVPPTAWPSHWTEESMINAIGHYRFVDSLVDIPHGLTVFKYVHETIPDSIAFGYKIMDSTGTAVYDLTGLNNTEGWEVDPSFTSRQAVRTHKTFSGGTYTITADPMARFFVVYSPTGNVSPIADAGADVVITLPTTSVSVSASASMDPDGTISSYAWTKISGPSTFNIVSPSSSNTVINNLVTGTYTFQVLVTDNDGGTDTDNITVIVLNPTGLIIKRKLVIPEQ